MLRLNADSQPHEFIRSQRRDDRFQAVVSAGAAALPQANRAKRQREIIANHDQRLRRLDLILGSQTTNCFAAEVHKGLRLHKLYALRFDDSGANQRLAFATLNADNRFGRRLVNEHKSQIVTRMRVIVSRISKTNDQEHFQLPIANCQLASCHQHKSAIGNRKSAMLLRLFAAFAFLFLLALADDFGFGWNFTFNRRRFNDFFLHDTDGGDNCVGLCQNLDVRRRRNIRNVEHLVNPEITNVDVEMLRNVARLATNLDLTNDLLENSRFLANANRFTNQTQRHSRFNLLALDQAFEIRMD